MTEQPEWNDTIREVWNSVITYRDKIEMIYKSRIPRTWLAQGKATKAGDMIQVAQWERERARLKDLIDQYERKIANALEILIAAGFKELP